MFKLESVEGVQVVMHDNKRAAVDEQLYDVLVQCHGQANHRGRDKTTVQVCVADLFRC